MGSQRHAPDLVAYYEGLLAEQEDSGLSVTEFAEEVGVSAATLYSWRRRLRDGGRAAQVVEVSLVDETRSASPGGSLALRVGGRFEVAVPADFDEGALLRLLGALERC